MNVTAEKSKNNIPNVISSIGYAAIFLCVLVWGWNKFQFVQSVSADAQILLQQKIAQNAFFGINMVTDKAISEVYCVGSKELGVTCKTIGNKSQIIRFKTTTPMPNFKLHAVKIVGNLKIQMEIRDSSGFPNYQDLGEIEKIVEVFRNPILG